MMLPLTGAVNWCNKIEFDDYKVIAAARTIVIVVVLQQILFEI